MAHTSCSDRTTVLRGNPVSLSGVELKAGDKAPDFQMVDCSLQKVGLADTGKGIRIFSVIPSLDTPVCDAQTRRFEDEAVKLPSLSIYTVSMDLPFAQTRWSGNYGVEHVKMLSDHFDASFGERYGTLIPDLRIESRAIFVVDGNDTVIHAEYVKEVGQHPDYDAALAIAKAALSEPMQAT